MARLSLLSIAVVLGMASSVQASIVELTFSGTFEGDMSGPFSYSMTYDTSLDTNTSFFATGTDMGGDTTTHEWHGYSASGITAVDFQFNGMEWLLSDLRTDMAPSWGVSADLWFDVDLATGATPTRTWLGFLNSSDVSLTLGTVDTSVGSEINLEDRSTIYSTEAEAVANSLTITRSDPDPIPEPASVITWTLLGVVGCIATWWKRRRKAG